MYYYIVNTIGRIDKVMDIMTVDEVATYLKMSPQVIRRWLRQGKLKGVKIGKEWRIDKADIDALMKKDK